MSTHVDGQRHATIVDGTHTPIATAEVQLTSFKPLVCRAFIALLGTLPTSACADREPPRLQLTVDARSHSGGGSQEASPALAESPVPAGVSVPKPSCERALTGAVESLQGEVIATVYATRAVPEYEVAGKAITAVLRALERLAPRKLRVVEGPAGAKGERAAESAGIAAGEIIAGRPTYLGVALRYEGRHEVITLRSPHETDRFTLELVTKLVRLRNQVENTPVSVGVHSKDGAELDLAALLPTAALPKAVAALGNAFSGYRFEAIGAGPAPIDPSVRALLVLGSGDDWADADLRRLDDFIVGGKAAAFFVGSVEPSRGELAAGRPAGGLESLLSGYGVDLADDAVFEPQRAFSANTGGRSGVVVSFPALLVAYGREIGPGRVGLDESFLPFSGGAPLSFPAASTLTLRPGRQSKAIGRVVAGTSPNAMSYQGRFMLTTTEMRGGSAAPRALAVAVEGSLQPAIPRSDAAVVVAGSSQSRLLVVSSSLFLTNPFRDADADGSRNAALLSSAYFARHGMNTIRALQNTLDWLTMTPDMAACASAE